MKSKTNLPLTILAILILSIAGSAQGGKKKLPREAEKKNAAAVMAKTEDEAATSTPVKPGSPELEKVYTDKNFLAACEILAAGGEMFLADSARVSRDGEKYAVTFDVVIEATKTPGQYRQLVYAFDGKEATVYFSGENDRYTAPKTTPGSNAKIIWPPKWWPKPPKSWPGSGGTGTGPIIPGEPWGDWHEVSRECHATVAPACSITLQGAWMKKEERTSTTNAGNKQTRWILIHCGCY